MLFSCFAQRGCACKTCLPIHGRRIVVSAGARDGNRLDRRGKQLACPQVFYSEDIVGQCVRFLGLFVKISGGAGVCSRIGKAAFEMKSKAFPLFVFS